MDAQPLRQPVAIALAATLAVVACGGGARSPAPAASAASPGRAPTRSAEVAPREALPFVHDDWPRALAEAKKTKRLVFVDAWAPWCHSCQSMRAYVLGDPALSPLAKDFVWLSIDTDKETNASFVSRFSNDVWPTLWIVDPEREEALLKWGGTATADELVTLLGATRDAGRDASEATIAFVRGNHAAARGDDAEAERSYRAALLAAAAARDEALGARVAEALVALLTAKDDFAGCASLALERGPALPPGTSRVAVLAGGLSCARDGKLRDATARLRDAVTRAVDDPDPRMIADDRSALFEELVLTATDAGDEATAKVIAARWAAFLEREAARAPTSQARAVFDAHRLEAYLALGEPARALPMLQQSERDFPDDYNPPARLATAYLEMHRLDDARASVERATARVHGARALRIFTLAADVAKARHDVGGERAALGEALARTERATLSPYQKKLRAGLETRLRALPR